MSDVLLIDNSIQQETVLVPVTAVQPDLVTQTDVVVYVPLASKNAHGIVKIGEGLHITPGGLLSFDRSEVTIKELALNGTLLVPDENKRVNIVLHKKDVGLANVDNTSDLDKPISTAVQNALDLLNTDLTDDILDVDDRLIVHIHDFNNPHRVTKHQVGLGNVDNTSDADKPVSRATQRELSRIQGLIKGSENAVSYESYEALVNDFNILGPDVYNVGQSVFIATLKVPDLWVYGVEEEFEEFTYIDDSTIESILNIDGTFKVGYYRLAALDTLKVDLSNYVTIDGVQSISGDKDFKGLLTLNNVRVVTEDDLPKEYVKNASVDGNTLTITNQDDNTIEFVVKEPDLSGYLPLTAGSGKPLTDILYADNGVRIGSSNYLRFVNEAKFITPSKVIRFGSSDAYNSDLLVMTQTYLRPGGNNTTLGNSSNQWKEIYGTTIYQNGKQVANAENLSAVTDATLSSDSTTLTITKRDGSSFNFSGGAGTQVLVDGETVDVFDADTKADKDDIPAKAINGYDGYLSATAAGVAEVGKYFDFHATKDDTKDFDVRVICPSLTTGVAVNLPSSSGTLALQENLNNYFPLSGGKTVTGFAAFNNYVRLNDTNTSKTGHSYLVHANNYFEVNYGDTNNVYKHNLLKIHETTKRINGFGQLWLNSENTTDGNNGNARFTIKSHAVGLADANPTANQALGCVAFVDNNDGYMAKLNALRDTNGVVKLQLLLRNNSGTNGTYSASNDMYATLLTAALSKTGGVSLTTVTPGASDNTTTIATTAWVRSRFLDKIYPVGSVYMSITNTSPASFLGGTWAALPAGYALWTATSGAGGTIAASLPNIKGTIEINGAEGDITPVSGAFTKSTRKDWGAGHASGNIPVITFNASNYNSIYSDSATTVQPPAYKVYAWRRTA